jgi:uncharacterized protein (TIGR00725 family)
LITPLRIAICGTSQPDVTEASLAEAVGRGLAVAGAVVYCGGLGGVMEAACRGARAANGLTVGILPSSDASSANEYVAVPVPTGCGEARNMILINCAEAVIAIGGGWGTLSEIALARRAGLAVVGLGTWEPSGAHPLAEPVTDPDEAVARALAAARQRRGSAGSVAYHLTISALPL